MKASALFLFFFSLLSLANASEPFQGFVVFGDSLSDNGNLYEFMKHRLPASPPYYEGRFTNGPVWVELLAEKAHSNIHQVVLENYAFGGAGILEDEEEEDGPLFTLQHEIDTYLLAHEGKARSDLIHVVWIGGNNYLAVPDAYEETVMKVNKAWSRSMERLVKKGARYILVLNIPDLGKTPAAREMELETLWSNAIERHNEVLEESFKALKEKYPEVKWVFFDAAFYINDMLEHPTHYGFSNVSDTCYDVLIEKPSLSSLLMMTKKQPLIAPSFDSCEGYLFFDPIHSTFHAHEIIAEKVYALLKRKFF